MVIDSLGIPHTLHTITIIDSCIGWFETFKTKGKPTIEETLEIFDINWFCRYPRPELITCNMGAEFSSEFTLLLKSYGIKVTKSTRQNLQSNAIIERIYQVMLNMLQTLEIQDFI